MNHYKTYIVRYWNHPSWENGGHINDCFGNSVSWVGKARTEGEALRKAKSANANTTTASLAQYATFRLHSITIEN